MHSYQSHQGQHSFPLQLKQTELWRHFQRNFNTNQFQCNYCGKGGRMDGVTADNLRSHLLNNHYQIMLKIVARKPTIKPPTSDFTSSIRPREIQRQYQNDIDNYETRVANDQWLDRLALDGYPVRQILASIFRRYQEDSASFAKYMARRAASLKNSKYKAKNFLPKLTITLQSKQIVPLLMDKYRISADGAQLLIQDFYWANQNQYQVLAQLTRRGMTVLRHEQNRTNAVIVFCDEQMKNSFSKFGDVVCVDFKPIKFKTNPKNKCNYLAGIFVGQDTNLHHTLFAVALINQDKYENYQIAIKYFIKAMRTNFYPQSFVIGSCGTLYNAVRDLSQSNTKNGQQSFGYYLSWHCLIDRLVKMQSSNSNMLEKEQIITKFIQSLQSYNEQQIKIKFIEIVKMSPNDKQLYQFISECYEYLNTQYKPYFVGFGLEKQNFTMLYKIMYNFIREVDNIGNFFQKVLKMQEMFLSRIKKGYENMSQQELRNIKLRVSDELLFLRRRLQVKLYKKFLYQYKQAATNIKIIGKSADGSCYQLKSISNGPQKSNVLVYIVKFDLQELRWKCNCGFIYATGIPCCHIIKMIRKFRGSLGYYINKRWMIHSNFNPQMPMFAHQLNMQPEREAEHEINQEYSPMAKTTAGLKQQYVEQQQQQAHQQVQYEQSNQQQQLEYYDNNQRSTYKQMQAEQQNEQAEHQYEHIDQQFKEIQHILKQQHNHASHYEEYENYNNAKIQNVQNDSNPNHNGNENEINKQHNVSQNKEKTEQNDQFKLYNQQQNKQVQNEQKIIIQKQQVQNKQKVDAANLQQSENQNQEISQQGEENNENKLMIVLQNDNGTIQKQQGVEEKLKIKCDINSQKQIGCRQQSEPKPQNINMSIAVQNLQHDAQSNIINYKITKAKSESIKVSQHQFNNVLLHTQMLQSQDNTSKPNDENNQSQ